MKELYDQTKERLKTIEDYLKPNVKIHTIWECEFDQQKYPEVDPHLKPIDKRDAFYGGRTETIQLYNNLSDLKRKEEYSKPNPSVNVYIALFTTAHARLKLYELLDILQERVLYMDTDSCIYNDDGSEAYEIVSKYNANHIKQFISAGPKDYSMKLDTEKLVSCCKGFRLNAEVEEKITLDKKIKIVTDENEKYETVKYDNIKIGKDHQLKTVKQVKAYDYMFDKRMKDDPDAKVILGRIMLSDYQICCLRDDGECPLTSKQMEVMEKFKGKKLSKFPPGWDAFIRPDKVYEYVFEKPCPEI
ncbi:unnamed protein product [Mytilus coruscus]|uniref:Uncharacterized protein n=1 Tax=Mytilus coruscus TaxID=42192 RepID=A0A6J8CIB3_MYTCO|nr:unnamed protein product [Mytilus coruscus]